MHLISLAFYLLLLGLGPGVSHAEHYHQRECEKVYQKLRLVELGKALARIRLELTPEWYEKNALIGFERTYSSKRLSNVLADNKRRHPEHLTPQTIRWRNFSHSKSAKEKLQKSLKGLKTVDGELIFQKQELNEIFRFLKVVMNADLVTLRISNNSTTGFKGVDYEPHLQTFLFEVRDYEGKDFLVTIEDGSIEVNQNPGLNSEQMNLWSKLDKRAFSKSFFSKEETLNSGGGTHMHWGWANPDQNLWLQRPDLLAAALKAPILYPALFYLTHSHVDLGAGSSAKAPFDLEDSEEAMVEFSNFVVGLEALSFHPDFSQELVVKYLKEHTPNFLKEHNSYLSLKNIDGDNPRIEIRLNDSFNSTEQLQAVANLWRGLLIWGDLAIFEGGIKFSNGPKQVWDSRPSDLFEDSKVLVDSVPGLSKSDKKALLQINGLNKKPRPRYHKVKSSQTGLIKVEKVYETLPNDYVTGSVEVEFSLDPGSLRSFLAVVGSDLVAMSARTELGTHKMLLEYDYFVDQYHLAFLLTDTYQVEKMFVVKVDASDSSNVRIDLTYPLEKALEDKDFAEKYFVNSLRRIGSVQLTDRLERVNPKLELGDHGEKSFKLIMSAVRRHPELSAVFSNFDTSDVKLPTTLEMSYGDTTIVDMWIEIGKKRLNTAELEFMEHNALIYVEDFREIDGAVKETLVGYEASFDVFFTTELSSTPVGARYKATWNKVTQEYTLEYLNGILPVVKMPD